MTRHTLFAVSTTLVAATALFASLPASSGTDQCGAAGSSAAGFASLLEQPTTAPSTQPSTGIQKVDVARFDALRAEKDSVILDVRTPKEFEAGHLPGAVNIPVTDESFDAEVAKLDKSKRYLVHCKTGKRSDAAVHKMQAMGFDHLYDLSGGIVAWSEAGMPVEK